MTHRTTLHEDDWMVAILPCHGRGQTGDEPCFGLPGNKLETVGGQMVAFVHDQVSIVPNQIVHDPFADHTLDDRHIQKAGRFPSSAADPANRASRQSKEGG